MILPFFLASLALIGQDTTTKGDWRNVYGSEGVVMARAIQSPPKYATVTINSPVYIWSSGTTDVRALQLGTSMVRQAAAWYGDNLSVNINITDGLSHQVSLYIVDWDGQGRSEVINGSNYSGFSGGLWVKFVLSGNTTITIANNGPSSAVVSGVFFDPAPNTFTPFPPNTGIGAQGQIAAGTSGQYAIYAVDGTTVSGHTLVKADIPQLDYSSLAGLPTLGTSSTHDAGDFQVSLMFTGNGTKTVTSTGSIIAGNCVRWDGNGNAVDAGAACGTGGGTGGGGTVNSGTAGQFAYYSASGTVVGGRTLVAGDIPTLNYDAKNAASAVLATSLQKASNLSDLTNAATARTSLGLGTAATSASTAFAPATSGSSPLKGNGSGGTSAATSSDVIGLFGSIVAARVFASPAATTGAPSFRALVATDIPALSYQAVLSFSGNGAKTVTATAAGVNGHCALWGTSGNLGDSGAACAGASSIVTGPSGALDCASNPYCDIVTSVVPLKAAANTWLGANDFSGAALFTVPKRTTPASASDTCTANDVFRDDNYIYVCIATNTLKRMAIATW